MPGPLDGYGLEEDMSNRSINADDENDPKEDGVDNSVSTNDAGSVNIPPNPDQEQLAKNIKDFSNPSTLYSSNVTTPIKQGLYNALGGDSNQVNPEDLTKSIREAALRKIGFQEPVKSKEDEITHKGEILGIPESTIRNKILDTTIDYGTDPAMYTPVLGEKLEAGLGEAGVDALSEMKGAGKGIETAANTSSYLPDAIEHVEDFSGAAQEKLGSKKLKAGALASLAGKRGMADGGIVQKSESAPIDISSLHPDSMNQVQNMDLSPKDHIKMASDNAEQAANKIKQANDLNNLYNTNNHPVANILKKQAAIHSKLADKHAAHALNKFKKR